MFISISYVGPMCFGTIPSNCYLHQECVQLSPGVGNACNYNL